MKLVHWPLKGTLSSSSSSFITPLAALLAYHTTDRVTTLVVRWLVAFVNRG